MLNDVHGEYGRICKFISHIAAHQIYIQTDFGELKNITTSAPLMINNKMSEFIGFFFSETYDLPVNETISS